MLAKIDAKKVINKTSIVAEIKNYLKRSILIKQFTECVPIKVKILRIVEVKSRIEK